MRVVAIALALLCSGCLFRDPPARPVKALCVMTEAQPVCYELVSGLEVECPAGL